MKPILVGLNNPYNPDPEHALAPFPERSAGWRLWRMLFDCVNDVPVSRAAYLAGMNRVEYLDAFDRHNLFGYPEPETMEKRRTIARDFIDRCVPAGSHVVLLGHVVLRSVGDALGAKLEPIFGHPQVACGTTWRWLPHPSGRCTAYNDPAVRALAGMVLADVLSHCSKEN